MTLARPGSWGSPKDNGGNSGRDGTAVTGAPLYTSGPHGAESSPRSKDAVARTPGHFVGTCLPRMDTDGGWRMISPCVGLGSLVLWHCSRDGTGGGGEPPRKHSAQRPCFTCGCKGPAVVPKIRWSDTAEGASARGPWACSQRFSRQALVLTHRLGVSLTCFNRSLSKVQYPKHDQLCTDVTLKTHVFGLPGSSVGLTSAFCSGHDPRVLRSSPASPLSGDLASPPPSALPLACALWCALSLSNKEIKYFLKN